MINSIGTNNQLFAAKNYRSQAKSETSDKTANSNTLSGRPVTEEDIENMREIKESSGFNPSAIAALGTTASNSNTLHIERVGDFTETQNPNAFGSANDIKDYISNLEGIDDDTKESILSSLDNIFKSSGESINLTEDSVGYFIGMKEADLREVIKGLPEEYKNQLNGMISDFSDSLIDDYVNKKGSNSKEQIKKDKADLMDLYDPTSETPLDNKKVNDLFDKKEKEIIEEYKKETKKENPRLPEEAIEMTAQLKNSLFGLGGNRDFLSDTLDSFGTGSYPKYSNPYSYNQLNVLA